MFLIPSLKVSQEIKKGSSVRKKCKASSSSYGYQDNLKPAKRKSGKQTSEPVLDQGTCDFYV